MSATVQFIQTSPEKLQAEITAGVKRQLDDFLKHYKPIHHAEYLSKQQVAQMFGVHISSIHNWCKNGTLKPLGLGGSRVYFLRSDIENSLIPLND